MGILNFGLYFIKIGNKEANIPNIEIMAKRERQKVNHIIFVVYNDAVLNVIAKKLADKIRVRTGICLATFSASGIKAIMTNTGM
jgi:hypothetical protein